MPPLPGLPLDVAHIVLTALGVGIWHYDIDADQLHCDDRWHSLLGLTPGTVTSIGDFSRVVHPYDLETATQVDLQAITDLIACRSTLSRRFPRDPGGWGRALVAIGRVDRDR